MTDFSFQPDWAEVYRKRACEGRKKAQRNRRLGYSLFYFRCDMRQALRDWKSYRKERAEDAKET